jgi:hypothetical protein
LIISDEMWDILSPATEAYENISREDVESGLLSGEFRLFRGSRSLAVTCAYGESLRVGLAGGDLQELQDIERDICAYARQRGYSYVEIVGRPGWEKVLTGYQRTAVLMRKELGSHGLH